MDILFFFLAIIGVVLLFFWAAQILDLMNRKDEEFPGRMDKALWLAILVLLPYFGAFIYAYWKSERAARAAESKHLADVIKSA